MAEEVFAYLRVPQGLHVLFGPVDAAAGFVDAEHADGVVCVVGARGEAPCEVGVETLGAEGYEDVDWRVLVRVLRGMTDDCLKKREGTRT